MTQALELPSRSLMQISGSDAEAFLQNLVTCDIEGLADGQLTLGALLTPQGKILFEFFLARDQHGFVAEMDSSLRSEFIKRLTFYKLRADVSLTPLDWSVGYSAEPVSPDGEDMVFADPRHERLGFRLWSRDTPLAPASSVYDEKRIALGVPEFLADYDSSSAFPHEVLMDQYGAAGVDFEKGCYVGQEVVSRMQHRGTARSRFCIVSAQSDLPPRGTVVIAGERDVGRLGSVSGLRGLALLRLDRVQTAVQGNTPISVDGVEVEVMLPGFVRFSWPADAA